MCFWREVDSEPFFLGIGGWAFCTLVFGTWHHIIPLEERLSALGSFVDFALCPDTCLNNRAVGDRSVAGSACHTPHMVVLEAVMYAALSILHNPGVCYTWHYSIAGSSVWEGMAFYRQDTAFPAQAYRLST